MSRWGRIVRGMIGMGLTFSAGVGAIVGTVAGVAALVVGGADGIEFIRLAVASALWAFPIGVAASGALALTARARSFDELSIPRFTLLGAGGGLLLYLPLALNAWAAWTPADAIANLVILVGLGSGSAATSLWIARRARPELEPGDAPEPIGAGDAGNTLPG